MGVGRCVFCSFFLVPCLYFGVPMAGPLAIHLKVIIIGVSVVYSYCVIVCLFYVFIYVNLSGYV
jgi:hypothetical protein